MMNNSHLKTWPDFLSWSFGGLEYASPTEAQSSKFSFQFKPVLAKRDYSFREEVLNACDRIEEKRAGRKVALCYSAGIDSELIARALHAKGIPFTLYFLDIWGLNRAAFEEWHKNFCKEIGETPEIISLDRAYFYEQYSCPAFAELGCEFPTYLALTYLFTKIPDQEFIVTGDGDLSRQGAYFRRPAGAPILAHDLELPFTSAQVALWLWSSRHRRPGEFCFFSSTPELIAAVMKHPSFLATGDTRELITAEFPQIQPRPKTNNWDDIAYRENAWIRAWLDRYARKEKALNYWQKSTITNVRLDDLYLS